MQTPGEENGIANGMIMRQAARVERRHEMTVTVLRADSPWAIANRPQVNNLPYIFGLTSDW